MEHNENEERSSHDSTASKPAETSENYSNKLILANMKTRFSAEDGNQGYDLNLSELIDTLIKIGKQSISIETKLSSYLFNKKSGGNSYRR